MAGGSTAPAGLAACVAALYTRSMTSDATPSSAFDAVLWDFGGVFTTSPFDNFTRFEQQRGLPKDFIRTINATNADDNAWAKMERSEVTPEQFGDLFEVESRAAGHSLHGREILPLLAGELQPVMVTALSIVGRHYKTACLTNNMRAGHGPSMSRDERRADEVGGVMDLFDHVVQSSEAGIRKPELRFYQIACETLDVIPERCVFLDDLGVNLKPARAMGMTTIKVLSAAQAIADLESTLGIPLRD